MSIDPPFHEILLEDILELLKPLLTRSRTPTELGDIKGKSASMVELDMNFLAEFGYVSRVGFSPNHWGLTNKGRALFLNESSDSECHSSPEQEGKK